MGFNFFSLYVFIAFLFVLTYFAEGKSLLTRQKPNPYQHHSVEKKNGLNFLNGEWSAPKYNSSTAFDQLKVLKIKTRANWVALTYCHFQKDVDSTGPIYPRSTSPTKAELSAIVHHAHASNISVLFRPCVDPDWSNPKSKGTWRGEIGRYFTTQDWNVWFQYYTSFLVEQAKLAQEIQVDFFSVGLEYITASAQTEHWRKVVAAVKKEYQIGPVTYCANHGNEVLYNGGMLSMRSLWMHTTAWHRILSPRQ